jgi:uncharacterized membrane protein
MKKHTAINEIARGAIIAAIYALLTIFLAPISSGLIQCRVAEALCVLPYYTFSAVPGLFVGCLIANLITGAPIWDVVFGSLATLLAAYTTYAMRKRVTKFLAPLPAVLYNAVIVGALLVYVYAVPVTYPVAALYVAAGQAAACFGLGLPLLLALERIKDKLF